MYMIIMYSLVVLYSLKKLKLNVTVLYFTTNYGSLINKLEVINKVAVLNEKLGSKRLKIINTNINQVNFKSGEQKIKQ